MIFFWKIRISFQSFLVLLLFLGCGNNDVLSQSLDVFLDINHNSSGSKYKIGIEKVVLPNNNYKIKIKKTGHVANNELIQWTIQYYDLNDKIQDRKIKLELKKGTETIENIEPLINAKAIKNICVEQIITPQIIKLPEAKEFNPFIDNKEAFILEGESITLDVAYNASNQNLSWYWKNKTNGETLTGKRIQISANRNYIFEVYAKYNNTNFTTAPKTLAIQVKKAFEIIDFNLIGPLKLIDDTTDFNIKLKINQNQVGEALRWEWYKESDNFSNIISSSQDLNVKANPIHKDSVFKVCPIYNSRNFGCKLITIKLNYLQAPDKFELKEPVKMFSDSAIIITTKVKSPKPSVWMWTIDGKVLSSKGDSIKIERPRNGMKICAYPILNRKGGIQLEKCITLNNVIVKTKLPEKITGRMERCSGESLFETYTLEGAMLGSESNSWVLFSEGKVIRKFTTDTLRLAPSKTTKYRICAENNIDNYKEFEIVVHKNPIISGQIIGKGDVCVGEKFILQIDGFTISNNIFLNWYKTDNVNKSRKFVGSGLQISDAIQYNSIYELEASYQGCLGERKLVKKVNIVPVPFKPTVLTPILKGGSSQKAEVSVSGSNEELRYEWSNDDFISIMGKGKTLKLYLKKGQNMVYVRAINSCGVISGTSVYPINRPRTGYFFMNFGTVISSIENINTAMVTLGGKGIYFRAKFTPSLLFNDQAVSTSFSSRNLEINNAGKVMNFPPSTGYYYSVNGISESNRQAITVGTNFGGKTLRFFLGGGYGERTMFWNLNLVSYSQSGQSTSVYAQNTEQSWKGIEGEAGLLLKLGKFNIMGGTSLIFDSNQNEPFFDIHLGLGFSTR